MTELDVNRSPMRAVFHVEWKYFYKNHCHKYCLAESNFIEEKEYIKRVNTLKKAEIALTMSKEIIFESLMHEYGQKILNMVYLMIKDQKIAEDITQETFMKAYMNWDCLEGNQSLRHGCIELRSMKRRSMSVPGRFERFFQSLPCKVNNKRKIR